MPAGAALVVAARSARLLAEAAAREGFEVIALDAFGDADTRRAARRWHCIATPADGQAPRIDAERLLAALAEIAAEGLPGPGWIAGSDLEADTALLAAGAQQLPLIGTAADDVRRVRDPHLFFGALAARGFAHPETRFDAPPEPHGWLRKSARGSGGWHIARIDASNFDAAVDAVDAVDGGSYFQREAPGRPMSALFVAGRQPTELPRSDVAFGSQPAPPEARWHRLVGMNELIVRPYGAHPHVYRGAVGPVALPAQAQAALAEAIDALVEHFGLRGLCSLDFLWHEGAWSLLELNPRPSASMALYPELPLIGWHLQACGLDAAVPRAWAPATPRIVRGIETVFARSRFVLGHDAAAALHARDDGHDLPAAGTRFEAGDPVCSVSAVGNNPNEVHALLAAKRQALRRQLACERAAFESEIP